MEFRLSTEAFEWLLLCWAKHGHRPEVLVADADSRLDYSKAKQEIDVILRHACHAGVS